MTLRLSGLFIYPIKSARGLSLREARLTARGLAHDRRFMIVDQDGLFLTQRQVPQMARLVPTIEAGQLRIAFDHQPGLRVPITPTGVAVQVKVWRDTVAALDCGDEAASFCSGALGQPARLVFMPDSTERQVQPAHANEGDVVSFADSFPYLLTSQDSLDELNARLPQPVPMSRFRPNLVVEGAGAYAEDGWSQLQVGGVTFEVRKPCDRCVVITTDQLTGERTGKEPLKTLAGYHTWNGKSAFGQNLLCRGDGVLRMGDAVSVLG